MRARFAKPRHWSLVGGLNLECSMQPHPDAQDSVGGEPSQPPVSTMRL